MRDPYNVLGVSKTANAGDVKSAFRKLAKKLHPDANKKDPSAATKFAELNAAYEILGDEKKRQAFDRGEIDAEGKPRFQGFEGFGGGHPGQQGGFRPGGGANFESFSFGQDGFQRRARGGGGMGGGFEDILKEMFGGRAQQARGPAEFESEDFGAAQQPRADINAALTVTLEEAAQGARKRVQLPTGKNLDVKIPAGITSGQQIRLKGQGGAGPWGAGDALITVTIAAHPHFTPDGADLRLDLPITLDEAVLGGKVRVPTLDGAVELAIPPNTSSGRTFRLRGKGLPAKDGQGFGGFGDLLATIRIVLPEQRDNELEALMERWRADRPYDPRKDFA